MTVQNMDIAAGSGLSFAQVQATNNPVEGPVDPLPAEVEVVVIGAGPTGLTATNLLGAAGVRTLLIERNRLTSDQPKAVVMDDEFMRTVHRLGVEPILRPHLTATPFGVHFMSPFGFAIVKAEGHITPNGFGNRNSVSQPMLEKILLEGARRRPTVSLCYGHELRGLDQREGHVDVAVRDGDGRDATVRAKYVVACDGANSLVRQQLSIPFDGKRLDEPHLVVDFAEFPDQVAFSRFLCNPKRPLNSILMPYGGRRIEFMLMPGDDRAAIATPEAIRRLVDRHTPYAGVPLKIIRAAVYGYSARIARRLRDGRVFLAGDAAHVMPPFGGSGMNTGARDVGNLCWKLAAVLRGQAGKGILASYDPERRNHIKQVIAYSVRVGRVANIRFWPLAVARDIAFAFLNLFPAIRAYFRDFRYMPRPRIPSGLILRDGGETVGLAFPRPALRDAAGQAAEFDAVAGPGFALIGIDVAPVVVQEAARHPLWAKLGARAVAIALDAPAPQGGHALDEPRHRAFLNQHRGLIVAMRPDRYIAGVARPQAMAELSDRFARLIAAGAQTSN